MSDEAALIYEERINALNGESGSGKSWVALHTAAEVLKDGGHVIYIDLEDHATSIVARLKALGCDRTQIVDQLVYIRPDQPMSPEAMDYLEEQIAARQVVLVVIDSIGELIALQGCKPDDDAIASLYRAIPRRLANLGPAVLLLDHVPKSNEHAPLYGVGSHRKRAAIDGASYMVEQIKPFAAGVDGKLKLVTAKDRNGWYPLGTTAAEVDIKSPSAGDRVDIEVRAPEVSEATGESRPTYLMGRASEFLSTQPRRQANRNAIKAALKGSNSTSRVIATLLAEGWIVEAQDGLQRIFTLLHPFDPLLSKAPDVRLSASDPDSF